MRTVVMTFSILNLMAGAFLAIVLAGENLLAAVGFGGALVVQGGYTFWYLIRHPTSPSARRLIIVGETLAVLVGGAGILNSIFESASVTLFMARSRSPV